MIKTGKEESENNILSYDKKIATIAHCIISSMRPRSFLSPILIGLSPKMHKDFGCKDILQALFHVGLCVSYEQILRFEASIIADPTNHSFSEDGYVQYVFDNADHNTCTSDGKDTFHSMGGIKVVTPASSVTSKKIIARLKKHHPLL